MTHSFYCTVSHANSLCWSHFPTSKCLLFNTLYQSEDRYSMSGMMNVCSDKDRCHFFAPLICKALMPQMNSAQKKRSPFTEFELHLANDRRKLRWFLKWSQSKEHSDTDTWTKSVRQLFVCRMLGSTTQDDWHWHVFGLFVLSFLCHLNKRPRGSFKGASKGQ